MYNPGALTLEYVNVLYALHVCVCAEYVNPLPFHSMPGTELGPVTVRDRLIDEQKMVSRVFISLWGGACEMYATLVCVSPSRPICRADT